MPEFVVILNYFYYYFEIILIFDHRNSPWCESWVNGVKIITAFVIKGNEHYEQHYAQCENHRNKQMSWSMSNTLLSVKICLFSFAMKVNSILCVKII